MENVGGTFNGCVFSECIGKRVKCYCSLSWVKAIVMYEEILEAVKQIPVVDSHEHLAVPDSYTAPREPIAFLLRGYFPSDLLSAGISPKELQILQNDEVSTEEKWPIFKKYWVKTEHTAYAREVKHIMRIYDEETLTLESLKRLSQKIDRLHGDRIVEFLESLNIKVALVDILGSLDMLKRFLKGEVKLPECYKPLIPLPLFHESVRSFYNIQNIAEVAGRTVTCLDEFLEVVEEIFRRLKGLGVVGVKDQSAYYRPLDFKPSTREKAEHLFNKCLMDPNNSLGWPEAKPLDDFLFREYMRFARNLSLPVQIHTGHMAGVRNRVDKANAAHFIRVLELHREVYFDLFHGNWPYMGDLLFLAKNYPNVYVNLCWVNIIDPIYSIDLLERAVVTIPHKKINGFGGDYFAPEMVPAHLTQAQENIARALSDLVSRKWISKTEVMNLAADWLYNNPNELFKLGLKPYSP
jgi:predicted TIM-barrel fold metal-dependent hydrolase